MSTSVVFNADTEPRISALFIGLLGQTRTVSKLLAFVGRQDYARLLYLSELLRVHIRARTRLFIGNFVPPLQQLLSFRGCGWTVRWHDLVILQTEGPWLEDQQQ